MSASGAIAGRIPVNDLSRSWMSTTDEGVAVVERVLRSGRYLLGEETAAFEEELDSLTRRVEALEKAEKSALSSDKPRLPTDEEIDRTMGIMERMMQRLMAIVKNLEGEEEKIAPQQPVPEKT